MADSVTDIANRALSFIGARRATDITSDNTKSANACNNAIARVRDEVFRSHPWNCLVTRDEDGLNRDLEDAVTITDITQANPGVVTAASHGYSNGDEVYIESVVGMTEVNDTFFFVAGKTTNTFQLLGENTTDYTAYDSAGTSKRVYVPDGSDFDYRYALPSDCLRLLTVDTDYEWRVEGAYILTNESYPLYITYIKQDTTVDNYDPLLFEAIAARLACEIVEELTSSNTKAQRCDAWFQNVMERAMAADGQEQSYAKFEDDTWLTDRY